MDKKPGDCFGFYTGEWKCTNGCRLVQQCKAFVNSDGLDVVSDVLEELMSELPDAHYLDSKFTRVALQQVLSPPTTLVTHRMAAEQEILEALDLGD